jgi:hypothetical protein
LVENSTHSRHQHSSLLSCFFFVASNQNFTDDSKFFVNIYSIISFTMPNISFQRRKGNNNREFKHNVGKK